METFVVGAESLFSNVFRVVTDVLYVYHRQPADVMNVARNRLCVTHSVSITPDFIVRESKSSVTLILECLECISLETNILAYTFPCYLLISNDDQALFSSQLVKTNKITLLLGCEI